MKVLLIFPSPSNCGPSNVVLSLMRYLNSENIEVYSVFFWDADENITKDIQSLSKGTFVLGRVGIKSFLSLYKIINKLNVDIIHSHCLVPDLFSSLVKILTSSKAKFITTIHCNLKEDYQSSYSFLKGKLYLYIHKVAVGLLDSRIFVSNSAAKAFNNKKIEVVYNGVKTKYRGALRVSAKRKLVYIGVIIERKNLAFLLDIYTQYLQEYYDLHVIGDGPLLPMYKQKYMEQGGVYFHGFKDNPTDYLDDQSIFVNPSVSEGLPMAVIESLSVGAPCLLSNINSHGEIKLLAPFGTELFEFNAPSFLNALKVQQNKLQEDSRAQIIVSEYERNFSSKVMGANYLSIYNRIVESLEDR